MLEEAAARVTQLGTDGSWQKESPSKEEPELFRNVSVMRKAFRARNEKATGQEFFRYGKLSVWASVESAGVV